MSLSHYSSQPARLSPVSPRRGGGRLPWGLLFLILGAGGAEALEVEPGIPILIDTAFEHGLSDVLTIVQAARTPGIGLVGVLISSDNPPAEARTAAKILGLAGRPDIPILVGKPTTAKSALPRQWAAETVWAAATPLSVTPFLVDQSHVYFSHLFYLATGPLTNLAQAFRADPGLAKRMAQLYLVAEPPGMPAAGGWTHDPEAADEVLASTLPITLLDSRVPPDSVLTRMRVLGLASAHTSLSEALIQLIVLLAGGLDPATEPLPATSYLPVSGRGGAGGGSLKTASVNFSDGMIREATGTGGRRISWGGEIDPQAALKEAIRRILDGRGELTMTLTRFVTDIENFTTSARTEIASRLAEGMPIVSVPEGFEGDEAFRFQLLAFMGGYLQMLSKLNDPLAPAWLDRFKNAFAHEAGLGLSLPDQACLHGRIELVPGQPNPIRFGLSNPGRQAVAEVRATLKLGDWTSSDQVSATTSESWFEFLTPAFPSDQSLPATAEFSVSFHCLDLPFAFSASLPVVPYPRAEVAHIRQTTEGLVIQAAPLWTSPRFSTPPVVTASVIGCADCRSVSGTIKGASAGTELVLTVEREETGVSRPAKVDVGESPGGPILSGRFALLPERESRLLLSGEGPSGSPAFAVRRGEDWGWSTDFPRGSASLDYQVAPSGLALSATRPVWVEVDYFAEGDEGDSFRIEAATESLQFQPVTAWMTKPERRDWRTDRFRASPMTEPLFQRGLIRWVRVQAGQDGDEIVRAIRVVH